MIDHNVELHETKAAVWVLCLPQRQHDRYAIEYCTRTCSSLKVWQLIEGEWIATTKLGRGGPSKLPANVQAAAEREILKRVSAVQ